MTPRHFQNHFGSSIRPWLTIIMVVSTVDLSIAKVCQDWKNGSFGMFESTRAVNSPFADRLKRGRILPFCIVKCSKYTLIRHPHQDITCLDVWEILSAQVCQIRSLIVPACVNNVTFCMKVVQEQVRQDRPQQLLRQFWLRPFPLNVLKALP